MKYEQMITSYWIKKCFEIYRIGRLYFFPLSRGENIRVFDIIYMQAALQSKFIECYYRREIGLYQREKGEEKWRINFIGHLSNS